MDDMRGRDTIGTPRPTPTGGALAWQLAEERRLLLEAVRAGVRLTAAERRRLNVLDYGGRGSGLRRR